MLNQIVLVGRVNTISKNHKDVNAVHVFLEVEREPHIANRDNKKDIFSIVLWQEMEKDFLKLCKAGSIIGVRGHIQSNIILDNEHAYYAVEVIAEKVSFLSNEVNR